MRDSHQSRILIPTFITYLVPLLPSSWPLVALDNLRDNVLRNIEAGLYLSLKSLKSLSDNHLHKSARLVDKQYVGRPE